MYSLKIRRFIHQGFKSAAQMAQSDISGQSLLAVLLELSQIIPNGLGTTASYKLFEAASLGTKLG